MFEITTVFSAADGTFSVVGGTFEAVKDTVAAWATAATNMAIAVAARTLAGFAALFIGNRLDRDGDSWNHELALPIGSSVRSQRGVANAGSRNWMTGTASARNVPSGFPWALEEFSIVYRFRYCSIGLCHQW
jgi:hypothetical protein